MQPGWTLARAMAALPPGGGALVRSTASEIQASLRPLKEAEPQGGPLTKSVADAFAPIGAKMRPDMSIEQAGYWTSALVLSFSDLPGRCVRAALADAVHIPFAFPTDMEAKVRQLAEDRVSRQREALRRLHAMLAEIHQANNPPAPMLEREEKPPLTLDEIRATPRNVRKIGVACGAILQADLDLVEAEELEQAGNSQL